MESSNQTAGAVATASAYNLLRTDVIANISSIHDASTAATAAMTQASGVGDDLATHEAATAQVHGLAAGIDVLGAYASGLYMQYIKTDATVSHTDGGNSQTNYISGEWPQAFTNVGAVTASCGAAHSWDAGSGHIENIRHIGFTVTAVTAAVRTYQSSSTTGQIPLYVIGIGN